ncbi:MAG: hypothetical protein KIT31_10060 [Deltaproteobacteria bacterium]|nr:hypothetical protein [Deltaproteobacteria bacterium]
MRKSLVLAATVACACGDNDGDPPCEVVPQALPPAGPLSDPAMLPMPDDCVPGGLAGLAGRWFVRDPDSLFQFHYPLYEERCDGAMATHGHEDDRDLTDDRRIQYQYSDGTVLFDYLYLRFEQPNFVYEIARAEAVCLRADGSLGGAYGAFQTDFGARTGTYLGSPFGPKEEAEAGGVVRVGELGTSSNGAPMSSYNLVVEGGLAYMAGPTGFDIIDVSDAKNPRALGHVDEGWNDVRVAHVGGRSYAYGASFAGEVTTVVDVTDPAAPVVAGVMPTYSHSVQIVDGKLYLANYTSAIPVFDIAANPALPVLLGEIRISDAPVPGAVHDLTVDGTRVFANHTTAGFVALDVSAGLEQPAVELARAPGSYSHASWAGTAGGTRLVLHGDEGLTGTPDGAAFLRVMGGDPAVSSFFMKELGRYQSRPEVGIHNFELHGDRVYIAYYQDGVRIVDVSTPAKPKEVGFYNTLDYATAIGAPFEGALGIRVVDGLIYVADSNRGLIILREQ